MLTSRTWYVIMFSWCLSNIKTKFSLKTNLESLFLVNAFKNIKFHEELLISPWQRVRTWTAVPHSFCIWTELCGNEILFLLNTERGNIRSLQNTKCIMYDPLFPKFEKYGKRRSLKTCRKSTKPFWKFFRKMVVHRRIFRNLNVQIQL